jgi:hypothetical protein
MANFSLPYEPQSTDHRVAERLHHETQEWLRQRSIGIITRAWSTVPAATAGDEEQGLPLAGLTPTERSA